MHLRLAWLFLGVLVSVVSLVACSSSGDGPPYTTGSRGGGGTSGGNGGQADDAGGPASDGGADAAAAVHVPGKATGSFTFVGSGTNANTSPLPATSGSVQAVDQAGKTETIISIAYDDEASYQRGFHIRLSGPFSVGATFPMPNPYNELSYFEDGKRTWSCVDDLPSGSVRVDALDGKHFELSVLGVSLRGMQDGSTGTFVLNGEIEGTLP